MKDMHVRVPVSLHRALAALAERDRVPLATKCKHIIEDALLGIKRGLTPDQLASVPIRDSSGFIYLVRCGDKYKIGKAKDVLKRLRSMQLPSYELVGKYGVADMSVAERAAHRKFKTDRVNGEWFSLSVSRLAQVCHFLEGLSGSDRK